MESPLPRLLLLQVPQLLGFRILYLGKLPRRVVLVAGHRPGVAHRGAAAAQAVVHVALPTQQDVVAALLRDKDYTPCLVVGGVLGNAVAKYPLRLTPHHVILVGHRKPLPVVPHLQQLAVPAVAVGGLPASPYHEYPPARPVVGVGDGLTGGLVMLPHQSAAPVVLIVQRPAAAGGTHQLARHVIAQGLRRAVAPRLRCRSPP